MGITERVWSFFDDERGTECVEFALVGLVVACGTVALTLKAKGWEALA